MPSEGRKKRDIPPAERCELGYHCYCWAYAVCCWCEKPFAEDDEETEVRDAE